MKIICPNCSAEYQIDGTFFDNEGRNVRCDQCTQEWYEYNFRNAKTTNNSDRTTLKKLAVEEYQILKTSGAKSNEIKSASELDTDIKFRIQESSDKLEQTKKFALNETEKTVLRLATYELLFAKKFKKLTIINEYISIIEVFGGNKDFANGILDNISQEFDKK